MEVEFVLSQMVRNLILSTVYQHHLAGGIHSGNRLFSFLVGLFFQPRHLVKELSYVSLFNIVSATNF